MSALIPSSTHRYRHPLGQNARHPHPHCQDRHAHPRPITATRGQGAEIGIPRSALWFNRSQCG